jgi:hypothetical protein
VDQQNFVFASFAYLNTLLVRKMAFCLQAWINTSLVVPTRKSELRLVSKLGGKVLGHTKPRLAHEDHDVFLLRLKDTFSKLMPHDLGLPTKFLQVELNDNTACAFWDEGLALTTFTKEFAVELSKDATMLSVAVPENRSKICLAIKLFRHVKNVCVFGVDSNHQVDIACVCSFDLTSLELYEVSLRLDSVAVQSSLKTLEFEGVSVRSSDVWKDLATFVPRTLERLDVTNCSNFTSLPSQLGFLHKVTILNIEESGLTGRIPSCIDQLRCLQQLSLWDNNLTGSIPSTLGDLQQLTSLILASNKLSGQIPSTLGKLHKLKVLNLSQNKLSGSIPPELAHASLLEQLDLSKNWLSGRLSKIPPELWPLLSMSGSFRLDGNFITNDTPTKMPIGTFW